MTCTETRQAGQPALAKNPVHVAHNGKGFVMVEYFHDIGRDETADGAVGDGNEWGRIGLYDDRAIRPRPQPLLRKAHHGGAQIEPDVPAVRCDMIAQQPRGQSSAAAAEFANGARLVERTMTDDVINGGIAEYGPQVLDTAQTVVEGLYVSMCNHGDRWNGAPPPYSSTCTVSYSAGRVISSNS